MSQEALFVQAVFIGGPHDGLSMEVPKADPNAVPTWYSLQIGLNEPLVMTSSTSSLAPDPTGDPSLGRTAHYRLARLRGAGKRGLQLVYRYAEVLDDGSA